MSTISAIIITKNEEERIADCIDSLTFCDEIIVVDNSSEDKTVDIAKRMGAKVVNYSSNNFSEMRNIGLRESRGDWIIYVDADERVTLELKNSILDLIKNSGRIENLNAYFVKRKNFYYGSSKKNEWPYVEKITRLFRKDSLKGWYGKLHESPEVKGNVGELPGYLLHYTHRDLTSMLNKTIEWSEIEARLRLAANHPKVTWWRFPRVMTTAFLDSYIRQRGWKVGTIGLIESIYQSFSAFITYARLWELQNKK